MAIVGQVGEKLMGHLCQHHLHYCPSDIGATKITSTETGTNWPYNSLFRLFPGVSPGQMQVNRNSSKPFHWKTDLQADGAMEARHKSV